MEGREHIIELGKVLAAEERSGFRNSSYNGGIGAFLRGWEPAAALALRHAQVREAVRALEHYGDLKHDERVASATKALRLLRGMFQRRATQEQASQTQAWAAAVTPDHPLTALPGIRRQDVQAFARLGVRTFHDLLYHVPHRYDDYSSQRRINALAAGATETVIAQVGDVRGFAMRNGGRGIAVTLRDDTGAIEAVFFQQPWLASQLVKGAWIVVSGSVTKDGIGRLQMVSPSWEKYSTKGRVHTGRLIPVHRLTNGLVERNARAIIKTVIDAVAPHVPDPLPGHIRERAGLCTLPAALREIHFPADNATLEAARRRLGFDELFAIQVGILRRKQAWGSQVDGISMPVSPEAHRALCQALPFALTSAQQRSIDAIGSDMARPVPMTRLLQGDVGSGKTVVAAAAALQAIAAGFQAALMAPTEILAEQHSRGLAKILQQVSLPGRPAPRVGLISGRMAGRARAELYQQAESGTVDLLVGTHALITERVQFANLGLIVVDEQHRFGVEQRQILVEKGRAPDMLLMTATPIPRTLTQAIHGDLDISVLDERPPGRKPIATRWLKGRERGVAYQQIRAEVNAGRQAFVVCPLIEDGANADIPSAEQVHTRLSQRTFPDLIIGLLHGRMSPAEKDRVMREFRDGGFHILVATAVIEVGIDVPNATTIVIEGAERFGLAQLHQFRGRVGRGAHASMCFLVSDGAGETTERRLRAMEQLDDGFQLAEIDLELRGPGAFFGTRQSGTPDLTIGMLADSRLLALARQEAEHLLADDPKLERPEHVALRTSIERFWHERTAEPVSADSAEQRSSTPRRT